MKLVLSRNLDAIICSPDFFEGQKKKTKFPSADTEVFYELFWFYLKVKTINQGPVQSLYKTKISGNFYLRERI